MSKAILISIVLFSFFLVLVCSSVHVSVEVSSPILHRVRESNNNHHNIINEESEAEIDSAETSRRGPKPTDPGYLSKRDLNFGKQFPLPLVSSAVGETSKIISPPQVVATLPSSGVKIYLYSNTLIARNRPGEIDSDGSPRSYNPTNTGLDANINGKDGSKWVGVAVRPGTNIPYIQGKDGIGPNPGYYVSTTALYEKSFPINDCRHWVNSEEIPYFVIPPTLAAVGAKQGDYGVIINEKNGKQVYTIIADSGPRSKYGEMSVAAANALGIRSNPRNGGANNGISYIIFRGSGAGQGTIPTLDEINTQGAALWTKFGELDALHKVPQK